MKQVVYRDSVLAKGSRALELWEEWQRAKTDRNVAQKKLDAHMKEVEQKAKQMNGEPLVESGWCVGMTVTDKEFVQWYTVNGPALASALGQTWNPVGKLSDQQKELLSQHCE